MLMSSVYGVGYPSIAVMCPIRWCCSILEVWATLMMGGLDTVFTSTSLWNGFQFFGITGIWRYMKSRSFILVRTMGHLSENKKIVGDYLSLHWKWGSTIRFRGYEREYVDSKLPRHVHVVAATITVIPSQLGRMGCASTSKLHGDISFYTFSVPLYTVKWI